MHVVSVLKSAILFLLPLAAALSACGQPTVTPPASGPGWTLVRAVTPSQAPQGIVIEQLGVDQFMVSITVPAGSTGCGTPTFVGFESSGSSYLAEIHRSPWDDSCAYTAATTFDVVVDRRSVPQEIN